MLLSIWRAFMVFSNVTKYASMSSFSFKWNRFSSWPHNVFDNVVWMPLMTCTSNYICSLMMSICLWTSFSLSTAISSSRLWLLSIKVCKSAQNSQSTFLSAACSYVLNELSYNLKKNMESWVLVQQSIYHCYHQMWRIIHRHQYRWKSYAMFMSCSKPSASRSSNFRLMKKLSKTTWWNLSLKWFVCVFTTVTPRPTSWIPSFPEYISNLWK